MSTAQVFHDLQVIQSRTGEVWRGGFGGSGGTSLKRLDFGCCELGISGPAIVHLIVKQESSITKKLRKEKKKRKKGSEGSKNI